MIRHEDHITRDMLRTEPDALFVFGDNLARRGLGGQAKEMRGEPNAVGIPTKRAPSNDPGAFLADTDFAKLKAVATPEFQRLAEHLKAGGTVVWPSAEIGSGRAQLKERAPRIWSWLFRAKHRLMQIAAETAADHPPTDTPLTARRRGGGRALSPPSPRTPDPVSERARGSER